MKKLIYQMDLMLSVIFKTILNIWLKKREAITDEDSPIKVYPNKIKNRITFKIKKRYKLELLTEETQKLLGSSKKEIEKDKDGELVPKIEIVDVVLIHCNVVNINKTHIINKKVKHCIRLYQINNLAN